MKTSEIPTLPLIRSAIVDLNSRVDNIVFGTTLDNKYRRKLTLWEDMRIPGSSVQRGASAPDLDPFLAAGDLLINRFDGGVTTNQIYFQVQMSHTHKLGTAIWPHVHWVPVDANAGNVYWQLEYSWANINEAFPASTTIGIADAAAGVAWTHQLASFAIIEKADTTVSSMLVCRLFRDPTNGADTYGSDAGLLEFDLHFENDMLGSRSESAK